MLPRWFTSKPFAVQLIILALVFDPLGFVGGYLLAPSLGVEPLLGGAYGLVAANVPMSLLVMQRSV
ncbi:MULTISPECIES: hypothetical protein [Haloferax]|uniref:DUF8141 domain-containing protein n=2 Tax=Haloferax gibbonsii TaxID=35746 RepID=A0A0K1IQ12_HALGI|nr:MULTISPECIES: hypothetical protein [Haloferax]AKU06637.1 hypothetical protein ABY42_02345 [Haloferax gibbonsii]ELZ83688.1 hypothetical protein C454_05242 [Haloferax gibbonsii ATCC 33959]QOS10629.1 uncharacterized protein HfgLR_02380 [Haloferax gibbonsii]RDZ54464.1 hypothetical protein C5C07_02735 [Haloferax sp. Atlit-4N]REA05895.1 hypothetical protein DEQ92_06440 [Haloferax sp. Atlit-6N]